MYSILFLKKRSYGEGKEKILGLFLKLVFN